MFKKEYEIWFYLLGILILIIIISIFFIQVYTPIIYGRKSVASLFGFEYTSNTAPKFTIDTNKLYIAKFYTNYGIFSALLYPKSAPLNTNNFISLSRSGFYEGTKFHRLIPDLLIQGGDRNTISSDTSKYGIGTPGYLIDDEINWNSLNLTTQQETLLRAKGYNSTPNLDSQLLGRYSLVMANYGPDTNGSQFFIVLAQDKDQRIAKLQGFFTVIGKVINGTDTLDTMNKIPVDNKYLSSPTPLKDIIVQKIEINEN